MPNSTRHVEPKLQPQQHSSLSLLPSGLHEGTRRFLPVPPLAWAKKLLSFSFSLSF